MRYFHFTSGRLFSAALALSTLFGLGQAQEKHEAGFVPGELLIKFKQTAATAQVQSIYSRVGLQQVTAYNKIGVVLCKLTKSQDVEAVAAECSNDPNVEYAEPNYIYHTFPVPTPPQRTPNDPRFDELWGMRNGNDADIDADEAWEVQTGSENVIVGIIDTGIDYNHEDLKDNIWFNPGESGGGKESNGVDDDGNGYVDDFRGWNFAYDDNDPFDDQGHGTHVSGTVGAIGDNGKGVVGVNWRVKLMALKFLDRNGSGQLADAIPAIIYAADHGAKLSSNSWGGGGFSQALQDAIEYARDKGSLFIAAAGNSSQNTDQFENYPSNYDVDNVISVAASDRNDKLASFSNYGKTTVDLAAPGVDILSTQPRNFRYQKLSGTSMATPHVSGVAALVLAQYPNLTYRQVLIRILGSVDPKGEFENITLTGGRLNARAALSTDPRAMMTTVYKNMPDTTGPYQVVAEAVDDGSITGVKMFYSINDGETVAVDMQNTSADRWEASIPGQPMETRISYVAEATDNEGNTSRTRTVKFTISETPEGGLPGRCCGDMGFTFNDDPHGETRVATAVANLALLVVVIGMVGRVRRRR